MKKINPQKGLREKNMLKIGLVGCGGIAQVHAHVLREMPEVDFCACADVRIERAKEMMAPTGGRAYASLEEMLAAEQLDVVHICTPHYLHTPMAQLCADHGVAVFTEKPPVITREQWAQFSALGEKVPVGICFQNRYNPNIVAAKELIATGKYGKLVGVRGFVTWSRNDEYYTGSDWRGRWATEGGGALMNQSIHTLDLMLRFTGKAEQLEAHMANRHLRGISEEEDTLEAYWRSGDASAIFFVSTAYTDNSPVMIEVQLEKAVLRIENDTLAVTVGDETEVTHYSMAGGVGKSYWGSGHAACIHDFYAALVEGRPYQNDIASVENTIDALLRIYEQGKPQLGY